MNTATRIFLRRKILYLFYTLSGRDQLINDQNARAFRANRLALQAWPRSAPRSCGSGRWSQRSRVWPRWCPRRGTRRPRRAPQPCCCRIFRKAEGYTLLLSAGPAPSDGPSFRQCLKARRFKYQRQAGGVVPPRPQLNRFPASARQPAQPSCPAGMSGLKFQQMCRHQDHREIHISDLCT